MTTQQRTLDDERQRLRNHGLTLLESYRDRQRPKIAGPLVSAAKKYAVVLCDGTRKRVMYRDMERIEQ